MANWTNITVELPAANDDGTRILASPWLVALKTIEDCDHLRIEAYGEWELLPGQDLHSGPDGRGDIPFAGDALILPTCPAGALIGRIGGSSASSDKISEGTEAKDGAPPIVFAIGSTCMIPLKELPHGPLFVGVNIRPRPIKIARLELKIFGTTLG